jgi:hypothetical protein
MTQSGWLGARGWEGDGVTASLCGFPSGVISHSGITVVTAAPSVEALKVPSLYLFGVFF